MANTDFSEISASLADMDYRWLLAAYFVLLSQVFLASLRWSRILTAIHIEYPPSATLRVVLIGLFFNQTLPSTVGGDVVRVWELTRSSIHVAEATTSVVLDRFVALGSILFMIALSIPILTDLLGSGSAQLSLILATAAGLFGMIVAINIDLLPGTSRNWRVIRWIAGFARDARRIFLSPSVAFIVLGLSLVITITTAFSVAMIAKALNVDITLLECCVLVPPVLLVSALPVSLAGWGVREAAMVVAFSYVNIEPNQSLVVSVVFGLTVMSVGLPGGIAWLLRPASQARSTSKNNSEGKNGSGTEP